MKIISQLIQETSSDEDVLKFTEATHTRINGRSFVTENSMWWWFIYARFIPTHTHDHSLFLLQKGAYTLTLFFTTNITRLEFRILMIRLIQFYKSRMRSTIQKKIKQITHTNKLKMYHCIRGSFPRKCTSFFWINPFCFWDRILNFNCFPTKWNNAKRNICL